MSIVHVLDAFNLYIVISMSVGHNVMDIPYNISMLEFDFGLISGEIIYLLGGCVFK